MRKIIQHSRAVNPIETFLFKSNSAESPNRGKIHSNMEEEEDTSPTTHQEN